MAGKEENLGGHRGAEGDNGGSRGMENVSAESAGDVAETLANISTEALQAELARRMEAMKKDKELEALEQKVSDYIKGGDELDFHDAMMAIHRFPSRELFEKLVHHSDVDLRMRLARSFEIEDYTDLLEKLCNDPESGIRAAAQYTMNNRNVGA